MLMKIGEMDASLNISPNLVKVGQTVKQLRCSNRNRDNLSAEMVKTRCQILGIQDVGSRHIKC